jgi:hypothetical protein
MKFCGHYFNMGNLFAQPESAPLAQTDPGDSGKQPRSNVLFFPDGKQPRSNVLFFPDQALPCRNWLVNGTGHLSKEWIFFFSFFFL